MLMLLFPRWNIFPTLSETCLAHDFIYLPNMLVGWLLQHEDGQYCAVNRCIISGKDGEDKRPLIDVL